MPPEGANGGGIAVSGAATIVDSTIAGNRAGDGGAGVTNVPGGDGGDGGGLFAAGATTIAGTTFTDNHSGAGSRGGSTSQMPREGGDGGASGGVHAAGPATISGSLFLANGTGAGGAGGDGPGLRGARGGNGGRGAGRSAGVGGVEVESSTFVGGTLGAGGPAGTPPGNPPVSPGAAGQFSAVLSIAQDGVTLTRTVTSGTCGLSTSAISDGGGNLTTDPACTGAFADPLLSPGGVPLAGSPALDAAASCPAADLAGTARPQGAGCDIGALEVPASPAAAAADALGFGTRTTGTSTALTVAVSNPGLPGLPLTIGVAGDPAFTVSGHTCGAVLVGGSDCTVTVAYAPAAAGAHTGVLRIGDGVVARPLAVTLSGTGVAPPPPPQPPGDPPPPVTPQPTVKQCVVPKLKGKTIAAARKALEKANCTLGKVTRSGRGKIGRVRAFSRKAGTVLPAGSTVRITVNRRRAL